MMAPAASASLVADQLPRLHAQRSRKPDDRSQLRFVRSAFDVAELNHVQVCRLRKLFLSPAASETVLAYQFTEGNGLGNPLPCSRRHLARIFVPG